MKNKKKFFYTLSCCLFSIGLWELLGYFFPKIKIVLPSPKQIILCCSYNYPILLTQSIVTLKEMFLGFFIALIVSMLLAWLMLQYCRFNSLIKPFFVFLQCMPMFTIAPIIVLWFGWGYQAIIIPTVLMIFFPLTLSIYQGFKSTPVAMEEYFSINQATKTQKFFKLYLPNSLPNIFSGLKIAAASTGISTLAGEWVAGQNGLGILLLESRRNYEIDLTFASLLTLGILTTGIYFLIEKVEFFINFFLYRKSSFKKVFSFLKLSILLFLLPLSSCGFKKNTSNQNKVTLLLDWISNPNHAPLFVGLERGFFKEENIDLKIKVLYDQGSCIPYLVTKQVDLILYHMPGCLKAKLQGAPIQIIGCLVEKSLQGLIFHNNDGSIKSPSDLSGKTIGFSIGNSNDTSFLDLILNYANIKNAKKKNVSADIISPFVTKKIDALYGGFWNIEGSHLESFDLNIGHFSTEDLNIPSAPQLLILAREGTLASEEYFVKRFQTALEKAIIFSRENPEEAFNIYFKSGGSYNKGIKTKNWEYKAWLKTVPLLASSQKINTDEIKTLAEWIIKHSSRSPSNLKNSKKEFFYPFA